MRRKHLSVIGDHQLLNTAHRLPISGNEPVVRLSGEPPYRSKASSLPEHRKAQLATCNLQLVTYSRSIPLPPMSAPEKALTFCRESFTNRDEFWTDQAKRIFWHRSFDQVCDFSRPPFARWFVGGETNLCYNAVDRHLTDRGDQAALHFISTEVDGRRTFTFRELTQEVNAFASVLRSLGLKRGDRAIIYLPIDNYWQTETGWPILALLPRIEEPRIRPGSPGIAMPGYDARIVEPRSGKQLPPGEKGVLALGLPLPPGCMSTVWKNDELFARHYCGQFAEEQLYSTFDYAIQDRDGYFFILGRSDDVINVAGHRLGTREIEETICTHSAVAEAAAVGAKDELRGQSIHCFIVAKQADALESEETQSRLRKEIEATVVSKLGAFARPAGIYLIRALPKTRSGKILRRAILAAAEGRDTGDLTTLEDPVALDSIREVLSKTASGEH
jgi:hypothetical protein